MPKPLSPFSLTLLEALDAQKRLNQADISKLYSKDTDFKKIAATLYRLERQELIQRSHDSYFLTKYGQEVIHISKPKRDGIWKLIIFDIPEKERRVRTILRQRLQALGFKKWQNSIWASPYALDPDLEKELGLLAKKYFIRLIKSTQINDTSDLELLFSDKSKASPKKKEAKLTANSSSPTIKSESK